jgi:hypothetical protein
MIGWRGLKSFSSEQETALCFSFHEVRGKFLVN